VRVAFVIPYFYPSSGYGGTPLLAYQMAQALTKRGHQVTVLTTDASREARISNEVIANIEENGLNGIRVHFYKNLSNGLAYRGRLFLPPAFFLNIRRMLSENQILHIHELRSLLSVAAYFAARSLRMPYVLSPHGGLQHLGKKTSKEIFDRMWGRAILKNAAAVCAISPSEEHNAAMFGIDPPRIYSLPPGMDMSHYEDLPHPGDFASRWNLRNRRIVLFLGRLNWIKGIDILIEAFNRLREFPNIHLVIAGPDDGAEAQLRALVNSRGLQDHVTFTGHLDDNKKVRALIDSDVLVIPSRHEAFSLTVLEAQACGTPVLLTSACELDNWAQRRMSIVLFRSGDAEELAQKLRETLSVRKNTAAMAAARNFVLKEFSSDALGARTERLYQLLAANLCE
jgi:glycosyltransferase involved in cell wall biosynthesis